MRWIEKRLHSPFAAPHGAARCLQQCRVVNPNIEDASSTSDKTSISIEYITKHGRRSTKAGVKRLMRGIYADSKEKTTYSANFYLALVVVKTLFA